MACALPLPGSIALRRLGGLSGGSPSGLTAVACPALRQRAHLRGAGRRGIGLLYALRAVGDAGTGLAVVALAVRLVQALHACSDPRWWVLLLDLALGAGLLAAAVVRLFDGGATSARAWWRRGPGPAHGSPRLADALVLTWRVHRSQCSVAWTVGCVRRPRPRAIGAASATWSATRRRHARCSPQAGRPGRGFYGTSRLMLA